MAKAANWRNGAPFGSCLQDFDSLVALQHFPHMNLYALDMALQVLVLPTSGYPWIGGGSLRIRSGLQHFTPFGQVLLHFSSLQPFHLGRLQF